MKASDGRLLNSSSMPRLVTSCSHFSNAIFASRICRVSSSRQGSLSVSVKLQETSEQHRTADAEHQVSNLEQSVRVSILNAKLRQTNMDLPTNEFDRYNGGLFKCKLCPHVSLLKSSNAIRHSQSSEHVARRYVVGFNGDTKSEPVVGFDATLSNHTLSTPTPSNLEDPLAQSLSDIFFPSDLTSPSVQKPDEHFILQNILHSVQMSDVAPVWEDEIPLHDVFEGQDNHGDSEDFADDEESPEGAAAGEGPNRTSTMHDWFPYESKAEFLTDLLFNSPRLRFSTSQQKAILSWARSLGAKNVPSFHALKKTQKSIGDNFIHCLTKETSSLGNVFYLNDISDTMAKDIVNPHVRKWMGLPCKEPTKANTNVAYRAGFYPLSSNNRASETWEGEKMSSLFTDDVATPMIQLLDGRTFYVNEIVQRTHDRWFLPLRWILRENDEMCADGLHVQQNTGGFHVLREDLEKNTRYRVSVDTFVRSYPELLRDGVDMKLCEHSREWTLKMPHPLRKLAGKRMVLSIPVIIFVDDVSGNVSKQWNKHYNVYCNNACLPRVKIYEEYNVHFVATSPHASPLELMQGVQKSLEKTYFSPTVAFDCQTQTEIMLQVYPHFLAADNPMAAEHCSCGGLQSNFFCRTCKVGGTQEFKISVEGYESLFKSAELRSTQETLDHVVEQFMIALDPGANNRLTLAIRNTGLKDSLAQPIIDATVKLGIELRKKDGVRRTAAEVHSLLKNYVEKQAGCGKSLINPNLHMRGLDVHSDTPTEILHTVLLGVVKYFWAQTYWILDKAKKINVFRSRLNSLDVSGLNSSPIQGDYMCQYRGGLIGKHFKIIAQVMSFAVTGLVSDDVRKGWLLIGSLTVLLWHTSIDNMEEYLAKLEITIEDLMSITAKCSPMILVTKPKFHFLVHLPHFIRRFGPAILFSTERFESFNFVFRLTSTFSNKMAPSRDIATKFLSLDRVKHIASGGYWKIESTGEWTCAAAKIPSHLREHPEHARLVGLSESSIPVPGDAKDFVHELDKKGKPLRRIRSFVWEATVAHTLVPENHIVPKTHVPPPETLIHMARAVVCAHGDVARVGSHILCNWEGGPFLPLVVAEIIEVVKAFPGGRQPKILVTAERFEPLGAAHPSLLMPQLCRTAQRRVLVVTDLLCSVNLQHDCQTSCCPIGKRNVKQEREETTHIREVVAHTDTTRYILNTHSLHNYEFIQRFLDAHTPLPSVLRAGEAKLLREEASSMVRNKKAQQQMAKETMECERTMGTAARDADGPESRLPSIGDHSNTDINTDIADPGLNTLPPSPSAVPPTMAAYSPGVFDHETKATSKRKSKAQSTGSGNAKQKASQDPHPVADSGRPKKQQRKQVSDAGAVAAENANLRKLLGGSSKSGNI